MPILVTDTSTRQKYANLYSMRLWPYQTSRWYSHADFSTNRSVRPGKYYPRTEELSKMIAFVLSGFVDECTTGGLMMHKHYKATVGSW